jgi:RimJ/RimL family protein N-acetyltransferase
MIAPTIHTERLILRALSLDDWEAYAAAWADPELTAFIGGEPRSRNTSWTKFTQAAGLWSLLGFGYWAFVDRETGAFLGNGGLAQFERGIEQLEGFPEVGWAFVPAAWGRGLASEAVGAIAHWSDIALTSSEIRCIIDPRNTPSIRVAEKNGFARIDEVENELGVSLVFSRKTQGGGGGKGLASGLGSHEHS